MGFKKILTGMQYDRGAGKRGLLRLSCLLVFGLLVSPATVARADNFLVSIKDMPLPPKFQELENEAVKFDKPNGRLVNTKAVGKGLVSTVRKFYMTTLPQLGWQQQKNKRYLRDGEDLLITYRQIATRVEIHFKIAPAD